MKKEIIIVGTILIILFFYYLFIFNNNKVNDNDNMININIIGYKRHIRPLFRQMDIDSMRWMLDLSNYEDVKKNSSKIYNSIKNSSMPCDAPWTQDKINLFKRWTESGMKP